MIIVWTQLTPEAKDCPVPGVMTSITPRFRHRLLRFRRCGVGGMKLHNPGVCNRMNQLFSVSPEMRAEPEFQSALVRLGIWLFAVTYVV